MSLSTTQYGYIVDPMVPFTDDKGKTIKNGFIRVFMAGTSTPVITYRNYDGATNQEKIELDNSGRVKHNVIGSKGSLYKVVVYNILHSQENPLLTVDKIAVLGANVTGTTIVTGLDSVTVQEENFLKATVEGTGVELSLDPTEVTNEVSTIGAAETAAPDYVVPLLDKTGTGDGKKISLANLFKFALDWISRLATTITSFASGDFFAVSNTTDGTRKMSKDTLLELTAQNALAGNVAPEFVPNETNAIAGKPYMYGGKLYVAKEDYSGAWDASKFETTSFEYLVKTRCPFSLSSADFKRYKGIPSSDNETWFVSSSAAGRHIAIPLLYGFDYVVKCNADQERFYAAILDSSYVIGDAEHGAVVPYASHWPGRLYKLTDSAVTFSKEYDDDCYLVLPVVDGAGNTVDYTISVAIRVTAEIEKECGRIIDSANPLSSVLSSDMTSYPGSLGTSSWFNDSTTHPAHVYLKLNPNRVYAVKSSASNANNYFVGILSAKQTSADIEDGDGRIYYSSNHPERVAVSDSFLFRTSADGEDAYLAVNVVGGSGVTTECSIYEFYTEFSAKEFMEEKKTRLQGCIYFDVSTSQRTYNVRLKDIIPAGEKAIFCLRTSIENWSYADTRLTSPVSKYFSRGQIAVDAQESSYDSLTISFGAGVILNNCKMCLYWSVNSGPELDEFRVASYNLGCMAYGEDSNPPVRTDEEVAAFREKIQDAMSATKPDILCIQEWDGRFSSDGAKIAWKVWKNYTTFCDAERGGYAGKAIASVFPYAVPFTMVDLPVEGSTLRNYAVTEINVKGRVVKIVSVHAGSASERPTQYAKLVDDFKNDPYVIICGDFNALSIDDYEPFLRAGYAMANGDVFKAVHTYIGNSITPPTQVSHTDNIVTKGFVVKQVGYYSDTEVTDHAMIYADVVIM